MSVRFCGLLADGGLSFSANSATSPKTVGGDAVTKCDEMCRWKEKATVVGRREFLLVISNININISLAASDR